MYDPIPVRSLIVHADGRTIPIFFKQANLLLNAPGPNNLKEWAVEVEGIDSESAERLEDLFHSVKTCTIGSNQMSIQVLLFSSDHSSDTRDLACYPLDFLQYEYLARAYNFGPT